MAKELSKQDVKLAIREVVDDLAVSYAVGAGTFLDSIIDHFSGMAEAFDKYYTMNLMNDRPAAAAAFLDLRIRAAVRADRTLRGRIPQLKKLRDRAQRMVRGQS